MRRRRGQWSFVGVVTGWAMSYGLCRLALAKTGLLEYFSEHCWPWSYCIGIVDRLGIINQVRNVGTSVIRTFHLSGMAAISLWTKGSGVTADLFRLADLFRRNLYASGYVPVFKELSGFVPGVPLPLKTQHSALATVVWSGYCLNWYVQV